VFVIAEFENPNDVLVLPHYAVELRNFAAVSWYSYVAVNIQADCHWFRGGNRFKQLCEKIVGNGKIVFGDVFLGYLYNDNAGISRFLASSPGQKFIIRQKFGGLKQPELPCTGDKHEHTDPKHEARHRWIAKCSSEPHHLDRLRLASDDPI